MIWATSVWKADGILYPRCEWECVITNSGVSKGEISLAVRSRYSESEVEQPAGATQRTASKEDLRSSSLISNDQIPVFSPNAGDMSNRLRMGPISNALECYSISKLTSLSTHTQLHSNVNITFPINPTLLTVCLVPANSLYLFLIPLPRRSTVYTSHFLAGL